MWDDVREIQKGVLGFTPDEPIIAATPTGRLGTPEDYVGAAIYLASDESSFVIGQTLIIDGGCLIS